MTTEDKQDLGTLADVIAQRDRLLRYVRADLAMNRSLLYEGYDADREMAIDAELNAALRDLIDQGDIAREDV